LIPTLFSFRSVVIVHIAQQRGYFSQLKMEQLPLYKESFY